MAYNHSNVNFSIFCGFCEYGQCSTLICCSSAPCGTSWGHSLTCIQMVAEWGGKVPEGFTLEESGSSGSSACPVLPHVASHPVIFPELLYSMTQPPEDWAWNWHSVTSSTFRWSKQVPNQPLHSIKGRGKYNPALDGKSGMYVQGGQVWYCDL